ncbi:hypothetical protein GBA65_07575 [Rubrobacter marinus]|uniref:ABM domain-containing protein n=1 Tax=Rubrobacter marinus TaxID=2653852 RepID=A0A6G8PW79_9ACTN|nr:hypothetical protein [Rubrobacter marinus]QIN78407.1 hypothetical protein GBA65_07575 [Rubrobacter marinus]
MFARISTFEGLAEQTAEGIRLARRQLLPVARLQEGFRGMYLMFDPESGRSLAMTLWETEEDMARSEEAVRRARTESAAVAGERVASVERYEVALSEPVTGEEVAGESLGGHDRDASPSAPPDPRP